MNTGPPRWETTQKMRSPSYPSPAELDAYAKKVANSPLTIQIFPNSVKVPQKKHVRRTVNGLDTSSQRLSPYSSQLSASAGLLAVLRAPLKVPPTVRPRGPHKTAMNVHTGPYGPQGTLNSSLIQSSSQQAPLTHTMSLQHPPLPQSAPQPPALQHKGLSHPGLLQRQQSVSQLPPAQRPGYPPHGLQRQQSVHLSQQCGPPAQHAPLLHSLRHHEAAALHQGPSHPPHQAPRGSSRTALALQTQELHHMPPLNLPHTQTVVGPPGGAPHPGGGGAHPGAPHPGGGGAHPGAPHPGGGAHTGGGAPHPGALHPPPTRVSLQGPPRAPQPGLPGPQPGPLRTHRPGSPTGQYLGPSGPQPGPQSKPPRAPQPGPTGELHSGPAGPQPDPPGPQQTGLQSGPLGGPHPFPSGHQPGGPQGPPRGPPTDQPGGAPFMGETVQQPLLGPFGPRKLPDADAPPNVTVSTSTIPLSMAGSLHQSRAGDLSSIVLQINQLCQARAGLGGTSVCEGQIANPSPISRNLLINASSRVAHPPPAGPPPGFQMIAGAEKAPGHTSGLPPGHPPGHPPAHPPGHPPGLPLTSQPSLTAPNGLQNFQSEVEKGQSLLQRSWAQHQLAHMQQPPEGAHPCKAPRLEGPSDCSFSAPQNLSYTHKVPSSAQAFPLKHQDKSRDSPPLCSLYMDSQYVQQTWGQPQEPSVVQGPRGGSSERFPGQKYKPGKEEPGVQPKHLPNMDFLPGNFQMPRYGEQSVEMRGPRQGPGPGGPLQGHHPGFR